MSRRRLAVAAATVLGVVATGAVPASAGSEEGAESDVPAHRVVADELNNPRQLNWTPSGKSLIVAEAGRGASSPEDCVGEGEEAFCVGPTGAVGTVAKPWRESVPYKRRVEGLPSGAGPNGTFSGGHTGADGVEPGHTDEFLSVFNGGGPEVPPAGLQYLIDAAKLGSRTPPPERLLPGGDFAVQLADLAAAEAEQNPGGLQVEPNPYAVIHYDPTPRKRSGDGFALVADAGANVIWKVERSRDAELPDFCTQGVTAEDFDPAACPIVETSVFYRWTDYGNPPEDASEEEAADFSAERPPEFVPTSLALDEDGHVWVGGLGSDVPGAASVVKLSPDGELLEQWDGFTGVTGVAVTDDALYVSQLFGATAPEPPGDSPSDEVPVTPSVPGSVVKVPFDDADGGRVEVDVPFPAGLAADHYGNVYAAVNSIAPAEGATDFFGPGSFDVGGGAVWELDFSHARPVEPPPGEEPVEWPPADSGGEWLPVPDDLFGGQYTVEACGSTVTIEPGDVVDDEYLAIDAADGSTYVFYRGAVTVDVSREDGALLDELDVGGPGYERYSEDGVTVTFSFEGPTITAAFDEVEAAVFVEAGLPAFFYYTGGNVTETVVLPEDPEAATIVSAEVTNNTATGVRDVCQMLDEAVAGD